MIIILSVTRPFDDVVAGQSAETAVIQKITNFVILPSVVRVGMAKSKLYHSIFNLPGLFHERCISEIAIIIRMQTERKMSRVKMEMTNRNRFLAVGLEAEAK